MPDLSPGFPVAAGNLSFFKAIAHLEHRMNFDAVETNDLVHFTCNTALQFPASDIQDISFTDNNITFTLNFLSLLGTCSSLPAYFSEAGLKRPEEKNPFSDFLSIFNHRLYALFYKAWKSGSIMHLEESELLRYFLFSGIIKVSDDSEGSKSLFRTLPCHARSATGLQCLLSGLLQGIPVLIKEFIPQKRELRNIEQLGGSLQLGKNAISGTSIIDYAGKFRVQIGPLLQGGLDSFLDDTQLINTIKAIIERYVADDLEYDIEIFFHSANLQTACLGLSELGKAICPGRFNENSIQSFIL